MIVLEDTDIIFMNHLVLTFMWVLESNFSSCNPIEIYSPYLKDLLCWDPLYTFLKLSFELTYFQKTPHPCKFVHFLFSVSTLGVWKPASFFTS